MNIISKFVKKMYSKIDEVDWLFDIDYFIHLLKLLQKKQKKKKKKNRIIFQKL